MSELLGAAELRAKLVAIAGETPKRVAGGMYRIALRVRTRSMERTPVEWGTLKGSHEVKQPVTAGGDISVEISVGGAAEEYAIYVHEDPEAHHEHGEYKFLEKSVHEAASTFLPDLAKEIGIEGMGR
jgi:hypothetical protein